VVKFIAEVSSNHHQNIERCFDFIDAAVNAHCHAVKFQLFKIDKLFAPEILSKSKLHTQRKQWELPLEFVPILAKRCKQKNIEFSCTPFYIEAVEFLTPYVDFLKIASYELLWNNLLIECARSGKPIILSTGMANLKEIQGAVKVLRDNNCKDLTLLHCTSSYPTPYNEANLAAIKQIHDFTNCDVGWSDHTVEPLVIHRAIQKWGAKVIEFHLDLDGKGPEYDTGHCWLPEEISKVIFDTKKGLEIDGNGNKSPTKSELNDREWRADPADGLRPLKSIRYDWKP
jgi:sialic acid synthase SpsE